MERNSLSIQIGQRLRSLRQQRQLSLDELSELTGVSKPMLGQIERGNSNPTVAILWKIASGLQVPLASFLSRNPSVKVLREKEQSKFHEDHDLFEIYNTFASPGIPLEIYRIKLLPGCIHRQEPHGPGVLKSVTVHSGTLTIEIDEEATVLDEGDAVSFSSDCTHVFKNESTDECECNVSIYYSNPTISN